MANSKTTSDTVLQQKEAALATVRERREALEAATPGLNGEAKAKAAQLDAAKLAVFTAKGTPGYEDDAAAARSVEAAQSALDAVLLARDAAEEQLGVLERAERQLIDEVGKLRAELTAARIEAAKTALATRIAQKAPALAEAVRDVVAFATVDGGGGVFPENLLRVIEQATGLDIVKVIVEGRERAQALRSGREA